jgi:hypothetical protein
MTWTRSTAISCRATPWPSLTSMPNRRFKVEHPNRIKGI